jgi:hypothetical protein
MSRFKKCESGYHKFAVQILAEWTGGIIEEPFYIDGKIVFIPDVVVYKNNIIQSIYEVVHSHPLSAKKYGLIQYYCYLNVCELTIFEVSADYILKQTEKPFRIESKECYIINPFEYEEYELIKSIS